MLVVHLLVALHHPYTFPAEKSGLSGILCAVPKRSRSNEAVNIADLASTDIVDCHCPS